MTWVSLIRGIFTENLRTKAMSLVVATVLFFFVQGQLTGSATIERLILRFSLVPELRQTRILLQEEYVLPGVKIRGNREEVERVLGELEKKRWRIEIAIDQSFLEQHRGEPITRIDRDFLAKHHIPDDKVEVVEDPTATHELRIEERVTLRGLQLAPAPDVNLKLSADNPWETSDGGPLKVEFNFASVDVSGPRSAFPNPDDEYRALYIRFTDPDEYLRTRRGGARERFAGPTGEIAWEESGIDARLQGLIRIDDLPPKEFERRATPYFEVVARRVEVVIPVDLAFRDSMTRALRLLDEFSYFNTQGLPAFADDSVERGRCPNLKVRMPKAMVERSTEIAKKLVLVLDLFSLEITDAMRKGEEDLIVPLRLSVKKPEDKGLLESVSLVTTGDQERPAVVFKHKR